MSFSLSYERVRRAHAAPTPPEKATSGEKQGRGERRKKGQKKRKKKKKRSRGSSSLTGHKPYR